MRNVLRSAVISVTVLVAMTGCGNKDKLQTAEGEVAIELGGEDSEIDYRDVIAVDGWITLADDEEGIISGVVKYAVDKQNVYILDRLKESVLVFGRDGAFVNAVGKMGMGPGEYPAGKDFTVNRDEKEIVILSVNSEVYVFGFDGVFKGHHKLSDAEITGIEYCDGRYVATTSYSAYPVGGKDSWLFYEFDAEFNCTAKWMQYKNTLQSAFNPMAQGLMCLGSEVYYVDNVHMRLIEIADRPEVRIKYVFDNPMSEDDMKDMMIFMQKQGEYAWLMNVIVAKDKVLAGYVDGGAYKVTVNKWNGESLVNGRYRGLTIDGVVGSDDYIYTVVTPDEYFDTWKSRDVMHPEIEPTEDSNVLILKWHIAK